MVTLAIIAVFGPSLSHAFVYDDHWTIARNHWLEGPLGDVIWPALRCEGHARGIPDAARPSMIASVWIDRRLFGLSPAGYHAHSLLLYIAVTLLAGLALLRMTKRWTVAFCATLFFAIAPVHAEAVASVNYREDLLAAIGVLVPLVLLLRPHAHPASWLEASISALAAAIGLWAKESGVALALLMLALPLCVPVDRAWLRAREKTLMGLVAVFILWGNWRAALVLAGDDIPRTASRSFAQFLFATARFELRSVRSALWPFSWSPEYPRFPPASRSGSCRSLHSLRPLSSWYAVTRGHALWGWGSRSCCSPLCPPRRYHGR